MKKELTKKDIIYRYEKIVQRWNEDKDLIRLFPNKYKDICRKLEGLKNGANYTLTDMTKEIMMDMGAKLGGAQQTHGKHNKMVRQYKKSKYKYKTDIPNFVDKCIKINKRDN